MSNLFLMGFEVNGLGFSMVMNQSPRLNLMQLNSFYKIFLILKDIKLIF